MCVSTSRKNGFEPRQHRRYRPLTSPLTSSAWANQSVCIAVLVEIWRLLDMDSASLEELHTAGLQAVLPGCVYQFNVGKNATNPLVVLEIEGC